MTTCPCARKVPIDYRGHDQEQARVLQAILDDLGEWLIVYVGDRRYRVSRHCIALHGITAADIARYEFEVLA